MSKKSITELQEELDRVKEQRAEALPEVVTVEVKFPFFSDFHCDSPDNRCGPKSQGIGCREDCVACYHSNVERYARAVKANYPEIKDSLDDIKKLVYANRDRKYILGGQNEI